MTVCIFEFVYTDFGAITLVLWLHVAFKIRTLEVDGGGESETAVYGEAIGSCVKWN